MSHESSRSPVYRISVAARLCSVHPQTLRAYERQGFIHPAREGEKNRLYSEADVNRVRQIQRLTRDLGVNLAGVEIILKLLDQLEDTRDDMQRQMQEFVAEAERRLVSMVKNSNSPVKQGETPLPVPKIRVKRFEI